LLGSVDSGVPRSRRSSDRVLSCCRRYPRRPRAQISKLKSLRREMSRIVSSNILSVRSERTLVKSIA